MNKYIALAFTSITLIGCGSSGGSSEDISTNLSVKILTDKSEVAEGKSIFFDSNVTGANGIVSYVWREGNTTLGNDKNLTKSDFTVGEHTVTLDVKDGEKNASDSKTITVSKFLVSLNSPKTAYQKDENISLEANVTDNVSVTSYTWSDQHIAWKDTTKWSNTQFENTTYKGKELEYDDLSDILGEKIDRPFSVGYHLVTLKVNANGIDKNSTFSFDVSDYSELNVTMVSNDSVIIQENLMWVNDDDLNKKACLAVHATKPEEINASKDFCEKLNFAGSDDWRNPTVTEISEFIKATIKANISPAYYAPCKILVGTEGGVNKAVITRYGDGKFGGSAGETYSKTMDEALKDGKNIGIRCVRDR